DIWGTTVSGNVAQGAEAVGSGLSGAASGGGVYAEPTFLILRATIADKVARAGAAGAGASRGVASGGGIAGNEDGRSGDNRDQLVMSTVARNVAETTDADGDPAGVGGNIHRPAAAVVPMTAIGALVAEGEAAPGSENCSFHPLSLGGDVEDDAAGQCGFATRGDARLGLLGDHGGPTATIPLLSGSAAIDAGSCDPNWYTRATLDQRGVPRPYETGCDAGAFESNPPVYPPPVDGGGSGDRGNGGGDVAQPERPIGRAPHGADAKPRAVASARRPLVRFSLRRPAIVALRIVALSKGRAHTLGTVRLGRRAAGRHVVTLPARAGGRALVAGRYRVTVVATNGDRSGRVVTTTALRVR
ncbi:MAG TPA: choice-of-anchor Q domain-containing protein, partial [Conexibacter sp.]|nr:choice-of-anchor Q domain-containing protein [Conexibacter sp.]